MHSTHAITIGSAGTIVAAVIWLASFNQPPKQVPVRDRQQTVVDAPEREPVKLPAPGPATTPEKRMVSSMLIGERILVTYAHPRTSLRNDLSQLASLTLSYRTLVKSHGAQPIGCNEDLAEALRGNNPYKQRFLPDDHPIFDSTGKIQDRWGTPVFVHTIAEGQWAIRSAGPDQLLWTNDDLAIQPDGQIIRGAAISEPSVSTSAHPADV